MDGLRESMRFGVKFESVYAVSGNHYDSAAKFVSNTLQMHA